MSHKKSQTSNQNSARSLNDEKKFLSQILTRVTDLEKREAELTHKLEKEKQRREHNYPNLTSIALGSALALLVIGIVLLIFSLMSTSIVLTFISIALTFWGALLLFIRPQDYVRSDLLYSTALSSLKIIDRLMNELSNSQSAIYIPADTSKKVFVFIPSEPITNIPKSENIVDKTFTTNPEGLVIFPPGLELSDFIEKKMRIKFAENTLESIEGRLSKLFIEDLEICKSFEIRLNNNKIDVKFRDSIYYDLCKKLQSYTRIYSSLGCPICSTVACIMVQILGKSIKFEKSNLLPDDKGIESSYQILEV